MDPWLLGATFVERERESTWEWCFLREFHVITCASMYSVFFKFFLLNMDPTNLRPYPVFPIPSCTGSHWPSPFLTRHFHGRDIHLRLLQLSKITFFCLVTLHFTPLINIQIGVLTKQLIRLIEIKKIFFIYLIWS